MILDVRKAACTLAACAALAAPHLGQAQSIHDEQQEVIAQVQSNRRAIVLMALALDDAQVQRFIPIYDEYQVERKKLLDRTADLLDFYAAHHDSMTDAASRKLLEDWFSLQKDEVDLARSCAKELRKVLPSAQVVRFVQVENKLDTLLHLKVVDNVPLAR